MPIDVRPHLEPSTTAVVVLECGEALIGPNSILPGLAQAAADNGMVDNIASVLDAARRVRAQVFYVIEAPRQGGVQRGRRDSVPLEVGDDGAWDGTHGQIVEALAPHDDDIVLERAHGYTGFFTTGLDAFLRAMHAKTVVLTGVSLNIAVVGTAIEALNLGYQVIVPNDGVASDPADYAPTLLRYTMRNVALVTTSSVITEFWNEHPSGGRRHDAEPQ
jgi:nicotinamidase-related amidase